MPHNAAEPLSIQEEIKRFVHQIIAPQAEEEGYGSWEDENDFSEEDPDTIPLTHHEVIAMDNEQLQDYAVEAGFIIQSEAPPSEPPAADVMPEALSGDGSEASSEPTSPPSD